jgi:endoglucanase
MVEKGSWDNGWFIPEGKFDWNAIDRFEIVAEHHDLAGIWLWFDNLLITDLDTAQVLVDSIYEVPTCLAYPSEEAQTIRIYQNPVHEHIYIESKHQEDLNFELFNMLGEKIISGILRQDAFMDVGYLQTRLYLLRISDDVNPGIFFRNKWY